MIDKSNLHGFLINIGYTVLYDTDANTLLVCTKDSIADIVNIAVILAKNNYMSQYIQLLSNAKIDYSHHDVTYIHI